MAFLHFLSFSKHTKSICRTIYSNGTYLTSATKPIKINQNFSLTARNADRCRSYSRRSWFKSKRSSYDIVDLCEVGPRRVVPDYIPKPSYSETGIEDEPKDHIEILDADDVQRMRQSCSLAKIVLDEISRHISVKMIPFILNEFLRDANFKLYFS